MKTKRLYSLIVAMLLMIIGVQAQENNKLYIPDVRAGVGEEAVLPVYVQNTSKVITGIQFTIKVEEGVSVNINSTTMTERLTNHKLNVASKGDSTYTVIIYSSDNSVLTGSDGVIANLPIYVSDTVKVGAKKSIEISKVVLSDNVGKNVLTESSSGVINTIKYPQLTLTAAKQEVKEGEKILFTITNEDAPSSPLDISISSDIPGRLKYPSTVTMEAKTSSVTFEVEALDNSEVSDTLTASVKVSASGHKDGECLLLIIDDDMPEIELELKPDVISEGDGISAIIGKITRKTKTDNRVTIVLSDDSDDKLYYSSKQIIMAANVTEVEFTMGAIDNASIDEERHYNVTAAVYIPSCSCSAKETSIGSVTKSITVTDDDGPTLKITSTQASVKEGSSITFNITHNVNTDKDITVNLTSDNDDAFEYDHNIVIPAGQKSTQVQVKAKENETIEGNRTIVFTVKTDGYATGTCWIQLTDQNIPDVSITDFTVTPSKLEVGQKVTVSVTMKNTGNAALPSLTRVNFYINNKTKELGHAYTADTLAVGGSLTITHELEMPDTPGDYILRAVVNEDRAVKELTYSNNSSQGASISLLPAFTATAQTDKSVYKTEETVIFSGKATGTKAANSDVEVYFINNEGYRQTLTAQTDDEGNYSVEYTLPKATSGHFIVGACYPNENLKTEMSSFDVYGLRLSACSNDIEFELGDTYQGTMTITNAVNLKQTGLKVTQNDSPENCVFAFTIPEKVEAGEQFTLNFTITPSAVSTGRTWQKMPITITSNEGASTDYSINYYINSRLAFLTADVSSINTTMTKGTKRDFPITIKNVGKGETGKISLGNLPNWMRTSTPHEMTSLHQGDSATIVLQLIPTDDLALNIPITGAISIICENASKQLNIPCSITPVSESEGKLIVDVVDEFTFETQEAPHVSNAKIVVKRPTTGELIAQGNSGGDGKFTVTLPEGQYAVTVTAENHEEYNNQIIVDAGKDNNHEAFVSYDAVTYSWDVVETEIEDSYEIETIVKYDTRVPKPVILISLPSERPEDGSIIPIVVTNKGFINAEDVNVSLAISGNWNIEFLSEPYLAKLAANQSEVFYAKLTSASSSDTRRKAPPTLEECLSLQAKLRAHYICGNKYDNTVTANDLRRWGQCLEIASSMRYSYGGGGGGYGPGGRIGGGGYGSGWWQIVPIPVKACKPGNNGDNNPNGDNPSGLPDIVPENKPEEQDCNSDEKPVLKYKLVPADGPRYDMLGVAADGVSKLKIVFDEDCVVPPDDCGKWTCSWSLVDDNGKIGELLGNKKSWDGVIYAAPEDYPSESGYEKTIIAKNDVYKDGEFQFSVEQKIIIARVPLVLLHGLNADIGTWSKFEESLISQRIYNAYQIDNTGYKETNCSYFTVNSTKPQEKISNLFRAYLEDGLLASKVDLVGHSMGGILSRLHVQYIMDSTKPNVHKVITVNTPHSGSEIGDLFQNLDAIGIPGVFSLGQLPTIFNLFSSTDAIYDLAVNSDAIDKYLNNKTALGKMVGIPVHAVVTEASYLKEIGSVEIKDWKSFVDYISHSPQRPVGIAASVFDKSKEGWLGLLQLAKGLCYDDLNEIGASDYVVSVQSQKGGLPESNISFVKGPWHCGSPDDANVQQNVLNALKASVKSSIFCTTGFDPVDRSFILDGGSHVLKARKRIATNIEHQGNLVANIHEDSLCVHFTPSNMEGISMIFVSFGTASYCAIDSTYLSCEIPSTFDGKISIYGLNKINGDNIYIDSLTISVPKSRSNPQSLFYPSKIYMQRDSCLMISLLCTWDDGSMNYVIPENAVSNKGIVKYEDGHIKAVKVGVDDIVFSYKGKTFTCPIVVYEEKESIDPNDDNESSNSVCSTITLSFKQEMVMTRQAFRGTLTVNNGDAVNEMKDVKLNLQVKDENGNIATSHEFQINAESLDGFEGKLDLTAGWKLKAKGTGVATILFIPTKYAAPTEPKKWSFGGTFSYTDPTTGLAVTKELYPVTLTVNPSPNLTMDYFMQRDVLGDDALTEDIVEPMVPAEFSLLINNKGYGDATNVKMVTNQPEIIDNEKGLLINFEILSSQLNGGEKTLALGQSVGTDFGTIPAGKTSYAQWWFTSSLLGHFTEYDVKATHLTSYGNPDLSLLDTVAVHELIHTLTIPKAETMRGFLVNDEKDSKDLPDMLYMTDGTVKAVAQATATLTDDGNNTYTLTAEPTAAGWNYGNLIDPTNGHKVLSSVTRNSDGTSISLDNFWQTDRTLRDNKDPLYEYRLHFADEMAATVETYTLTFVDKPMTILDVDSIVGASEEDGIVTEPIEKVTVYFNKDVAASTFTADDLELTRAGSKLEVEKIGITRVNGQQFELDIKELTAENGYYVLTVQTAGIKDTKSFYGEYGRKQSWTQYRDGKIDMILNYEVEKGWNWISSNLEDKDKSDVNTFLDPIKDKVDRLVGFKSELINDPEYGFVGGLTSFNPVESYKLLVNDSEMFGHEGKAVEPSTNAISLDKGWNWIGYLPVLPLSVETALEGLTPMENDVLKGQDVFSTYTDNKWVGTLTEMNPGEGYMYYSGQATSFVYPKVYPTTEKTARKRSGIIEPEVPWRYNAHLYADNMTLIGKLYSDDNLVGNDEFVVAAFVGNECRGIGKYINGLVFMTIHGTLSMAETISFRVYSQETGKELDVTERLIFDGHNIGSVKQPMALHLSGATNISDISSGFSISPRPLRNRLYINGDISTLKDVQILSVNGQKVLSVNHYSSEGIDVGNLIPGVYIVVLTRNDGMTYHEKVMKINN